MLSNVMGKLYYGDYFLKEKVAPKDPEYISLSKEFDELITEIKEKFSETEFELLEKVLDLNAMMEDFHSNVFFQIGISFGLQLMVESEEKIRLLDEKV